MKILVVEDTDLQREYWGVTLTKMGYDVVKANHGKAAWILFQETPFQVVLTDWTMPYMNGLELTRRIREHPSGAGTYVIIGTVMDSKRSIMEAMKAGVDDFMIKPMDPDLLRARLMVAERWLKLKDEVFKLEGLLPICMYCKKIRSKDGKIQSADLLQWEPIEAFMHQKGQAKFTHSICPECNATVVQKELEAIKAEAQTLGKGRSRRQSL